ncbi:hypothetical protein SMF913_14717 [Streptomyces malaysiensis]|uniref:Uncharacterized protein n=1 Tax=Streptomyces malaysiensis TaxID=92644 RepID=A0A2J7ZEJ5_STRMQ|nr:hypothetical protein SMF913_14717 [Streptomyces malaysiensis]
MGVRRLCVRAGLSWDFTMIIEVFHRL